MCLAINPTSEIIEESCCLQVDKWEDFQCQPHINQLEQNKLLDLKLRFEHRIDKDAKESIQGICHHYNDIPGI
jgi:hypothetical protein